tara:strand:- start:5897 stop:7018 length:1122 start_codon:yes stop_codon:yes gene_type:complete
MDVLINTLSSTQLYFCIAALIFAFLAKNLGQSRLIVMLLSASAIFFDLYKADYEVMIEPILITGSYLRGWLDIPQYGFLLLTFCALYFGRSVADRSQSQSPIQRYLLETIKSPILVGGLLSETAQIRKLYRQLTPSARLELGVRGLASQVLLLTLSLSLIQAASNLTQLTINEIEINGQLQINSIFEILTLDSATSWLLSFVSDYFLVFILVLYSLGISAIVVLIFTFISANVRNKKSDYAGAYIFAIGVLALRYRYFIIFMQLLYASFIILSGHSPGSGIELRNEPIWLMITIIVFVIIFVIVESYIGLILPLRTTHDLFDNPLGYAALHSVIKIGVGIATFPLLVAALGGYSYGAQLIANQFITLIISWFV